MFGVLRGLGDKRLLTGCVALCLLMWQPLQGTPIFINEFHYDNTGTDTGEAIEIAGPAGTDLTGWSLVLYSGADGQMYNTTGLTGTIPNLQSGFGTIGFNFPVNGIQNGAPDGIALVDSLAAVQQFLSYEGLFMALDGPANGMLSVDIGVYETNSTPIGFSLQLMGSGSQYEDFVWAVPGANTFAAVNTGQTFIAEIPEPGTFALLALGLAVIASRRRFARIR